MRYDERLQQIQGQLQKTQEALYLTLSLENKRQFEAALNQAFRFAFEAEKLTLQARALPAYSGHPKAKERTEALIEKAVPVDIRFTEEKWLAVRFPALLPKKERGGVDYIRGFLWPAMRRFIQSHPPIRYDDCVLIIRHVYDRDRPERLFRDHDNIEVNAVVDIVIMHLLRDDSPTQCSHFYCSVKGDADGTEFYIVPQADFGRFIGALNAGKIGAPGDRPDAS